MEINRQLGQLVNKRPSLETTKKADFDQCNIELFEKECTEKFTEMNHMI